MQSGEIQATGTLLRRALGGSVSLIRDLHGAIAGRPFSALGPAAAPVRVIHDGIADAVYWTVGRTADRALREASRAVALARAPDVASLSESPRAGIALGALNGVMGDALADERSPLALPMTLRRRGRNVDPDRNGLAEAHPEATPRLAIFVHGLPAPRWHQPLPAPEPPRGLRADSRLVGVGTDERVGASVG